MNEKQIDQFEKVEAQLVGFLEEFQHLTKKSLDDGVNKFKLKHVNAVLAGANALLKPAQRPFADFEQFDVDDVPTNSDVLLILRQYASCLEEVRAANVHTDYRGHCYCNINDRESERRARAPAKLKKG